MAGTIVLLAVIAVMVLVTFAVWRLTRRLLTVGDMKDFSVSRQWLIEHQGDERS
jgi:hypothetical protein